MDSLKNAVVYSEMRFYHRSDVLYLLTRVFTRQFFPRYGDRTVDQMVQAARSTKQNIVEGSVDGQTSTETELKLLGIARGSNQELLKDYEDYLKTKGLQEWHDSKNPRFNALHKFCTEHYLYDDYQDVLPKLNDEELANMAICLCHQVDSALEKHIKRVAEDFEVNGGTRERMMAARLKQRAAQKQIIEDQAHEIEDLKKTIDYLKRLLDDNNIDY